MFIFLHPCCWKEFMHICILKFGMLSAVIVGPVRFYYPCNWMAALPRHKRVFVEWIDVWRI